MRGDNPVPDGKKIVGNLRVGKGGIAMLGKALLLAILTAAFLVHPCPPQPTKPNR